MFRFFVYIEIKVSVCLVEQRRFLLFCIRHTWSPVKESHADDSKVFYHVSV